MRDLHCKEILLFHSSRSSEARLNQDLLIQQLSLIKDPGSFHHSALPPSVGQPAPQANFLHSHKMATTAPNITPEEKVFLSS